MAKQVASFDKFLNKAKDLRNDGQDWGKALATALFLENHPLYVEVVYTLRINTFASDDWAPFFLEVVGSKWPK